MLKVAVVIRAGSVVVMREKMSGSRRDAGSGKNAELDQSRRAAVSIAKRMDPRDIDVGKNRLQHRVQKVLGVIIAVTMEVWTVEPVAHGLDEELAVLRRCPAVCGPNHNVAGAQLSRHHVIF